MKKSTRAGLWGAGLVGAAALTSYPLLVRPWLLKWGANEDELTRPLPGDEIVPFPRNQSTRALTVRVPPTDVWPWLVQIGQGRGGFYSYDWLENLFGLDIHSADRLEAGLQKLEVGDRIRMAPERMGDTYLEVAAIEPNRALVLKTPGDESANLARGLPHASWAFVPLASENGTETRLVARWRSTYGDRFKDALFNQYLIEPIHFTMERKMLLGIRARAEGAMG